MVSATIGLGTHFALFRNDVTTLATASAIAKALGHGGRLRILAMLRAGPLSVCQIASVLGGAVSTVSEHLTELRRAGLVCEERRGKWVFCRLNSTDAAAALFAPMLAAIETDPGIRRDAAKAASLRTQSVDAVCAAVARRAAVVVP